jgi:hypoxanthine phosphoribosyltransferase
VSGRPEPLLGPEELAAEVRRLAAEIRADHPDGVVLVGVLKGALLFCADLARALGGIEVLVDFIAISRFAPDSGRVRILQDTTLDLAGRDVVLVEDMVDTGLTATYLLGELRRRGPRRVRLCSLLDRPVRRIVPLPVDYRGCEIGDVFVVGYGLHVADLYRNLPGIHVVPAEVVAADPAACVADLYPALAAEPGGVGSRGSTGRGAE